LVPERNRDRHDGALRQLLAAARPKPTPQTITALHRNGTEFKLEITTLLITSEAGKRIQVIARSTREAVEARLQEAEQIFRDLIDRLEDGYFEVDLTGVYNFVNEAYCRMTGRAAEELLGKSFKQLFKDDAKVKATQAAYSRVYQ